MPRLIEASAGVVAVSPELEQEDFWCLNVMFVASVTKEVKVVVVVDRNLRKALNTIKSQEVKENSG